MVKQRRTLADIEQYPSPQEVINTLETHDTWEYKHDLATYLRRDKALVATLYLGALRVSEALRLVKSQFRYTDDKIEVTGILLSKERKTGKPRRHRFREAWLPLTGERHPLTMLVEDRLADISMDSLLFPFKRKRAWQIVNKMTGMWNHYFRALGEEYLYGKWKGDILAVSDYVKVNPTVLTEYIRHRYKQHESV